MCTVSAGKVGGVGDGGLRFQVAGFPVHLPLGGILGVLLIAYLWAPAFEGPGSSGIGLAAVFAVLLYVAVLVHELAHAVAARAFGFPVHGITLWLLGGYTVYERRETRPGRELVVALVGPLSTLAIAAACRLGSTLTGGSVGAVLDALAWTNLLLAVLNLLPGAPLDGGAIVKSTVWKLSGSESSGAKAAGYAGLVIAAALGVVAVIGILGGSTGILLTAVLAAFIGFGAYQSLKAAKQHGVLDQVSATLPGLIRPVLTVSEREMLGAALDRWDRTRQAGVVTVDGQGRLLAALSLPAAEAVPAVRRDEVEIGPFTLAITADQRVVLGPDPSTMVAEMADSGQSLVFVSDENGRPLGILTAADVNRALGQR